MKLIIRNIPDNFTNTFMLNEILSSFTSCKEVIRFIKGSKSLPMALISFDCKTDFENALLKGVYIDLFYFKPEKYISKIKPVRCYNCSRLGHIATNCRQEKTCYKCGKSNHTSNECTAEKPSCVNCDCLHYSTDVKCPKYVAVLQSLNNDKKFL